MASAFKNRAESGGPLAGGSSICKLSNDRGSVVVFFTQLLLAVLFIGAMLLDILRIERAGTSLQRAADAAALAGASQLRPSDPVYANRLDGWHMAKKALFVALNENLIYGAGRYIEDDFTGQVCGGTAGTKCSKPAGLQVPCVSASIASLNADKPDLSCFPEEAVVAGFYTPYSLTFYDFSSVQVGVERGAYVSNNFLPLERQAFGNTATDFMGVDSVRVRLTLRRLPYSMMGLLGFSNAKNITREAVAAVT